MFTPPETQPRVAARRPQPAGQLAQDTQSTATPRSGRSAPCSSKELSFHESSGRLSPHAWSRWWLAARPFHALPSEQQVPGRCAMSVPCRRSTSLGRQGCAACRCCPSCWFSPRASAELCLAHTSAGLRSRTRRPLAAEEGQAHSLIECPRVCRVGWRRRTRRRRRDLPHKSFISVTRDQVNDS